MHDCDDDGDDGDDGDDDNDDVLCKNFAKTDFECKTISQNSTPIDFRCHAINIYHMHQPK